MGKISLLLVAADKETEVVRFPLEMCGRKQDWTPISQAWDLAEKATLLSELSFVWGFGFLTTKAEDC